MIEEEDVDPFTLYQLIKEQQQEQEVEEEFSGVEGILRREGLVEEILGEVEEEEVLSSSGVPLYLTRPAPLSLDMAEALPFLCGLFLLLLVLLYMGIRRKSKKTLSKDDSVPLSLDEFQNVAKDIEESGVNAKLNMWLEKASSLSLLSRMATASNDAIKQLSSNQVHKKDVNGIVAAVKRVQNIVLNVFDEDEAANSIFKLNGIGSSDADEILAIISAFIESANSRMMIRVSHNIAKEFEDMKKQELGNLSIAVKLENVSNSLFGIQVCKLCDNMYPFMNMKETREFVDAATFIESNRDEKNRKALEQENVLSSNMLLSFQESHRMNSSQSSEVLTLQNDVNVEGKRESETSNESVSEATSCHESSALTSFSTVNNDSISAVAHFHQVAFLHQYNSMKADSDRSLMMKLQSLKETFENADEAAGVRAFNFVKEFRTRVDLEHRIQEAKIAMHHEVDKLVDRRRYFIEEKSRKKMRQNDCFRWYSRLTVLIGAIFFFYQSMIVDTDARYGHVLSPSFEMAEGELFNWIMFQIRMICKYINGRDDECINGDVDIEFDFMKNENRFYFQSNMSGFSSMAYQIVLSFRSNLWRGVELFVQHYFQIDPDWLYHTVLPCLFDFVLALFPAWVCSNILSYFRLTRVSSLCMTLVTIYRCRKAIFMLWLQLRGIGIVLLSPLLIDLALIVFDNQVSWRYYFIKRNPRSRNPFVLRYNMRSWLLYVIYPLLHITLCAIMGGDWINS